MQTVVFSDKKTGEKVYMTPEELRKQLLEMKEAEGEFPLSEGVIKQASPEQLVKMLQEIGNTDGGNKDGSIELIEV